MAITRAEFLKKRTSPDLIEHELPDGDSVLLRQPSAKIYREYKRSMRDKNGDPIPERQKYADELLVGRIMVEADGTLMFSDEDILSGIFDELKMFSLTSVVAKAYEMLGIIESDEDREKNLSETDSTAPS
jgi:hypothetical protein